MSPELGTRDGVSRGGRQGSNYFSRRVQLAFGRVYSAQTTELGTLNFQASSMSSSTPRVCASAEALSRSQWGVSANRERAAVSPSTSCEPPSGGVFPLQLAGSQFAAVFSVV